MTALERYRTAWLFGSEVFEGGIDSGSRPLSIFLLKFQQARERLRLFPEQPERGTLKKTSGFLGGNDRKSYILQTFSEARSEDANGGIN